MKGLLLALILFVVILSVWASNTYVQHFNQDSETTATSGWFFKTTLNLTEYNNVSTGNDLWGTFDRYTRSDRHTETITVYCNDYCKDK